MNSDERRLVAGAEIRDQLREFETTRPTPSQDENDRMAAGELVMLKRWDLAPIDPWSFDPTEPPGRPAGGPPPANIAAPLAAGPAVVAQLAVNTGSWTGAGLSYA